MKWKEVLNLLIIAFYSVVLTWVAWKLFELLVVSIVGEGGFDV